MVQMKNTHVTGTLPQLCGFLQNKPSPSWVRIPGRLPVDPEVIVRDERKHREEAHALYKDLVEEAAYVPIAEEDFFLEPLVAVLRRSLCSRNKQDIDARLAHHH